MLNSLFPYGFIMIGLFGFLLYMLGTLSGMIVTILGRSKNQMSVILAVGILAIIAVVLGFLQYHMVFDLLCRQYTC